MGRRREEKGNRLVYGLITSPGMFTHDLTNITTISTATTTTTS